MKDDKGYFLQIKAMDQETAFTAGLLGGVLGVGIAAAMTPVRKIRLDIMTGKFDYGEQIAGGTHYARENKNTVSFFSSTFNSKSSRLQLFIDGELKCILREETWYSFTLSHPDDTLMVKVVSVNGLEAEKTIVARPGKTDIYLLIEKKKKNPEVSRVQSNSIDGIESLMKAENRIEWPSAGQNTVD